MKFRNEEKIRVKMQAKTLQILKSNVKTNQHKPLSKRQFEMINDLSYSIVSKEVREKDQRRKMLLNFNKDETKILTQVNDINFDS